MLLGLQPDIHNQYGKSYKVAKHIDISNTKGSFSTQAIGTRYRAFW